jgi:transcriptional regulator with XRE-family HTH domain
MSSDNTPGSAPAKTTRKEGSAVQPPAPLSGSVTPSPITLGARIQRVRLRRELSVRDLAEAAGVNKNTILRLEKGLTPSYATLARVCEALGVHVAQLTQPEPDEAHTIALHDREQAVRRGFLTGLMPKGTETGGEGAVVLFQDGTGMPSFAADEKVLLSVLTCRLPGGRLNAAVLELFGESESVTHPGEEMVFCLKGTARLTVAGRSYRLREGDAATFWCSERHSYGPMPDDDDEAEDTLPVRVLSVWIDTREEAHGGDLAR